MTTKVKRMKVKPILLLVVLLSCYCYSATVSISDSSSPVVLIRCDDLGMCHTVNLAAKQVLETGMPVSFSVMFACPWYQEAIDLLRRYPHASVGIHLTLNAEWKNYRWGPVSGKSAVPSLVDSLGFFFPSRAAFFAHHPQLGEIETELRAQIERAMHCGIQIDYVDYHMGTAVDRPELRALVESLAKHYGLGVSRYFGETDVDGVYSAPIASKVDTLLARTRSLPHTSINLMVFHIGLQTPEMDALEDLNSFGLREMSKHREAELKSVTSASFRQLVESQHVQLTTYRDVIKATGLTGMKRPVQKD